jgi:hypothetical protein
LHNHRLRENLPGQKLTESRTAQKTPVRRNQKLENVQSVRRNQKLENVQSVQGNQKLENVQSVQGNQSVQSIG